MRNIFLFLIVGFFLQMPAVSEAQILGKLKKKAEKQVEKEVDKALEGETEEPKTEEKQTKEGEKTDDDSHDYRQNAAFDPVQYYIRRFDFSRHLVSD